jgi:hypothetical protein
VLKAMPGLLQLNLHGTEVTKTSLDSLSRALPNCTVIPEFFCCLHACVDHGWRHGAQAVRRFALPG